MSNNNSITWRNGGEEAIGRDEDGDNGVTHSHPRSIKSWRLSCEEDNI